MAAISRVRVGWSGFPGGPGVSTFYALDATTLLDPLRAMFVTLGLAVPQGITLQVESAGDIIEATTGALSGAWSSTPVAAAVGNVGGAYAAPAGVVITWLTATILDAHRIKGRTFVVPLSGGSYATDGTLIPATLSAYEGAAAAFVTATSGNLVIWHRPRKARAATATQPAVVARVGGHAVVTGSRVADKVAVLRSRRD